MTKITMTIVLAVALSGCAGKGQPGDGGPSSAGTSGTASDVDNGGSTSSSIALACSVAPSDCITGAPIARRGSISGSEDDKARQQLGAMAPVGR